DQTQDTGNCVCFLCLPLHLQKRGCALLLPIQSSICLRKNSRRMISGSALPHSITLVVLLYMSCHQAAGSGYASAMTSIKLTIRYGLPTARRFILLLTCQKVSSMYGDVVLTL